MKTKNKKTLYAKGEQRKITKKCCNFLGEGNKCLSSKCRLYYCHLFTMGCDNYVPLT